MVSLWETRFGDDRYGESGDATDMGPTWRKNGRIVHHALVPPAVYAASRLGKGCLSEAFALGCKPICRIVDAIAARLPSSPFRQTSRLISEEDLTAEALVACLHDFPASHSLRPECETGSTRWLLDFMARMNAYGSLRKVLLRDRENKIIGWYLYCLRRGGVGQFVRGWTSH